MKQVTIHDKVFQLYIPSEKIIETIDRIAVQMNQDLIGKNPLFICILNGSFMFAADLYKRLTLPESEISFVKLASYAGDHTTGEVKQLIGLNERIKGRTVVVLEDIVDSGLTIGHIREQLEGMNPRQVLVATLLLKPDALKMPVHLDYIGMEIPNRFIVGYGLDYDGFGRNLTDIYSVIE
jgi:hypoxanthine phosphoribosyltransferase